MLPFKALLICAKRSPHYMPKKFVTTKAIQLIPTVRSSPWVRVNSNAYFRAFLVDECTTLPELFSKILKQFPQKYGFGFREIIDEEKQCLPDGRVLKKVKLSDYKWFRCEEIDAKIDLIFKGFLFVGIKPKDIVLILAETRLEWMLSFQSLLRLGSTVATLYSTLAPEGILHGINETEVSHLITNYDVLSKLSPILEKMPKIKCIVYMEGPEEPDINKLFTEDQRHRVRFYSLSQIQELGKENKHLKGSDPGADDTAVVMYTSGSTGVPKGVNISHSNILSAIKGFNSMLTVLEEDDLYCAYLPMAHIMEMVVQMLFMANGLPIGFATTNTLTDQSNGLMKGTKGDLTLLKPTVMPAVPLVLDRLRIGIEAIAHRNAITKLIFNFFYHQKEFWTKYGFKTPIINYIFCNRFKSVLGGKVRFVASGGAPLSPYTHQFIRNCFNVILIQGYGLTETCAAGTANDLDDTSVGFVGPPLEGIQIKLVDWVEGNYKLDDQPNPRGEVVIGGNNVAKGYFKNDKLTEESFKVEDGVRWFYTGDIAEIYRDGNVKIIDRKKDIIKLSKGEYISLAKVEESLKKDDFVDNLCVYGNPMYDYLVALIMPNKPELKALANSLSKPELSFVELCKDNDINAKILESIQKEGRLSQLSKTEIPAKIKLCSEEWVPDTGLVTNALKIRRKNIQQYYQKDIDLMYGIYNDTS